VFLRRRERTKCKKKKSPMVSACLRKGIREKGSLDAHETEKTLKGKKPLIERVIQGGGRRAKVRPERGGAKRWAERKESERY